MVISPRVTSPRQIDFSSLQALLAGPRFAGKTGADLAEAVWRFIVDDVEGVYHFWPALERATGRTVWDPLKLLNCFGWAICGQNANLLALLWRAAGFENRTVGLSGHVVPEVRHDGGWHLYDGDLKAYHRRHPPAEAHVAAVAECAADPSLISAQRNPSEPYYVSDRTPEKMAGLYASFGPGGPPFDDQSLTMDFALRPGETLERHAVPQYRWIWFDNYTESRRRYGREWNQAGPWERHKPHRTYGNGRWVYAPDLTDKSGDFDAGVLEAHGMEASARGVISAARGRQWCVFDFDSPWVFAGVPGAEGDGPPEEGCRLDAVVTMASSSSTSRIRMAVEPDRPWFTLWESRRRGRQKVSLDLTEHVVNASRYLLRVEFDAARRGSCCLEALRTESWFMVAPASIGRLFEGVNDLTVRFGDARGELTRRWVVQTDFRGEDDVRAKTCRTENLRVDPDSDDRIAPSDPSRDYEIVFRLDAPPTGRLTRVYAFASIRGKDPDDRAEGRVAALVSASEHGPWREIFVAPVPAHRNRWHFSAQGEVDLAGAGRTAFVKFVGKAGMNEVKVRPHWVDSRAVGARTPLTVRHVWEEAGGCCKIHTERIRPPHKPYGYRIICGPGPKLRSLVMTAGKNRGR